MECIPAALVRTDWTVIATWAGVVVNAAVVATAFIVQRAQAQSDRDLSNTDYRLASSNGLRAVSSGILGLNAARLALADDDASLEPALERLDREISINAFFLAQPQPEFRTLEMLIEVRDDLRRYAGILKSLIEPPSDADGIFNGLDRSVARLTASTDHLRWVTLHEEASKRADELAKP